MEGSGYQDLFNDSVYEDLIVNNLTVTGDLDLSEAVIIDLPVDNVTIEFDSVLKVKDNGITDAKIHDVSASKVTAGTFPGDLAIDGNFTINTSHFLVGNVQGNLTGNVTGDIVTDNITAATTAGIRINSTLKMISGTIEGPTTGDLFILSAGNILIDSSIAPASGSGPVTVGNSTNRFGIFGIDGDFSGDANISGNLTIGGTFTISTFSASTISCADIFSNATGPASDSIQIHTRVIVGPGKTLFMDSVNSATVNGHILVAAPVDFTGNLSANVINANTAINNNLSLNAQFGTVVLDGVAVNINAPITGTVNLGSLTPTSVLGLDGSKNMTTLSYSQGSSANSLVQMDASGNIVVNNVTTTSIGKLATNTISNVSGGKILLQPSAGSKGIDILPPSQQNMTMTLRPSALDSGLEIGSIFTTSGVMPNTLNKDVVIANGNSTGNIHLGNSGTPSIMMITPSDVIIPNFGIRFGATSPSLSVYTGSSAFTPTMGDGTNTFTLSTAVGRFNRIGSIVAVDIWCVWTSKGSATGNLRVSLPFGIGSSWRRCTLSLGFFSGIPYTGMVTVSGTNGTTFVNLISVLEAGTASTIACSAMASAGEIQMSGVFDLG